MPSSPAIQETTDVASAGRPWWKVCCAGCLLFLLAAVVGCFVLIRVWSGPVKEDLHELPSSYPTALVPYRLSEARQITLSRGTQKSRIMQFMTAPIRWMSAWVDPSPHMTEALSGYASVLQHVDTVTIGWAGLPASREEVIAYYQKLFDDQHMTVETFHDVPQSTDHLFAKGERATMEVDVHDTSEITGVDQVVVIVDFLAEK